MSVALEFSKNSHHYSTFNIIQNSVCEEVVKKTTSHPSHIIDLGCGEGALYRKIIEHPEWKIERFIGVDFSEGMLTLHPKAKSVHLHHANFNHASLYEYLQALKCEHLFSLSALQWAEDLENIFSYLKVLECGLSLAIFTSGTFKTLHKTAGVTPLLRSAQEVEALAQKSFDAEVYTKQYRLTFDSTREMFRYIKKSGVSGSRNVLSVSQTRQLMKEYPLNYLEFEVIFINTTK